MPERLCVRDTLFLLAHDEDHHFRPRVHLPTLAIGLAGAVLIDLIFASRIHIEHNRATLIDLYDRSLVGDPIADQALGFVRAHEQAPLRDQLTVLGSGLYDRTLGALMAAGLVTSATRRFGRPRPQPTDAMIVVRARGGPRHSIRSTEGLDMANDACCALLQALGLQSVLFLGEDGDLKHAFDQVTNRLHNHAQWPYNGVLSIVEAVEGAAGDIAVAVYRD